MTTKPFVFSGQIKNCYDSHVHWPSTGHWVRRLSLHLLRKQQDIKHIVIKPEHFEGEWLLGFGWDQNTFPDQNFPDKNILDELFPNHPVCLTRIDGHAVWVNQRALERAGLWQKNVVAPAGGAIPLDAEGWPTGVLIDQALQLVKAVLPKNSRASLRSDLLAGQRAFHAAGFTHIRDLTCDADQWSVARELENSGELQLAVEEFFGEYHPARFRETIRVALSAKQERSRLMRVKGIKVFYDGALGSEGALLSEPYHNCKHVNYGLRLIEPALLREMLIECAQNQLELAVHVIGDQAAHEVISTAADLKKINKLGAFHLEHAELLRPDTLQLLAGLPVTCHFQPCHWLSDKKWLKEKIGHLAQHAFRWRAVGELQLPLYFGSDSPIEESCLPRTGQAVHDGAAHDIPEPILPWTHYHAHPDSQWVSDCVSQFTESRLTSLRFAGRIISLPGE